ncbi:MAG: UDP-N-acetylmuramoyl-L-alanine--D-glutamate ligase [Desulfosalsimonadaceae bacterium]
MDTAGKHIVVVGLGSTGRAVVRFLARRGARITVTDSAPPESLQEALSDLSDLEGADISMELGAHPEGCMQSADMIVVSPGVDHTMEPFERAAQKGVPVIGEIELACRFIRTPIIAVTGTNGKSTTTLLAGQMLEDAGFTVFVGGNLGTPLIAYADQQEAADFAVVELSSFQLDTIVSFRPHVALLLNITADHLDRYTDFSAYVASKARIFENQKASDTAVLNLEDPAAAGLIPQIEARVLGYARSENSRAAAFQEDSRIRFCLPRRKPYFLDCSHIPLIGAHNRENIAAAGLAAAAAGVSAESIEKTVQGFHGLSHRMSPVEVIKGVAYIDDSKATNVNAVVRALESFSTPVILIMGGREKGGGYAELKPLLPGRVKHLIVMGEAAGAIENELDEKAPVSRAADMAEAVRTSAALGEAGDTVLLSPACASFDMYESYARRGDDFIACVRKMEARAHG